MRIALYGGSFDPPHIGHVMAMTYALSMNNPQQLWMLPCWEHAHGKNLSRFADRMEMCRAAASAFGSRVLVSDAEARYQTRYTRDLVAALKRDHPHDQFSLVVGRDVAGQIADWENSAGLLGMLDELVEVGRMGYGNDGATLLSFVVPDVSSSTIRNHLFAGEFDAVKATLPPPVLSYIQQHTLYRQDA